MNDTEFIGTMDINLIEFQARLNAISGSFDNSILSDVWSFRQKSDSTITVDFNEFYKLEVRHRGWGNAHGLEAIDAYKLAWMGSAERSTPEQFRSKLYGLAIFLETLQALRISQVTLENLSQVLDFFLMHRWHNCDLQARATPHSIVSFWRMWCATEWRAAFSALDIDIISTSINHDSVKSQLKLAIPRLTNEEMTYADWVDGGTFNQLTLDYGQYFIEHCLSFFEKNIALGTAIASTLAECPNIAERVGIHPTSAGKIIRRMLTGYGIEDLFNEGASAQVASPIKVITAFHQAFDHFRNTYRRMQFLSEMLDRKIVAEFLGDLGAPDTEDNIDRFRMIIWLWITKGDRGATKSLIRTSTTDFLASEFFKMVELYRTVIEGRHAGHPISVSGYIDLGLEEPSPNHDGHLPGALISLLEHMGLTCFVAETGWRRSEYGLSTTSFEVSRNRDRLDQNAFPYRFNAVWYVQKTGGEILERREVTFDAYVLAMRMADLLHAGVDQPCLYSTISTKQDVFASDNAVAMAVRHPWTHYVSHYERFRELDEINHASTMNSSPQTPEKELTESSAVPRLINVGDAHPTLLAAWSRARSELPVIEFFFANPNSPDKTNWLWQFSQGSLRPDWDSMIRSRLGPDILDWIGSLDEDQLKSRVNSRCISSEIVSDCLYPTPHALRHMWVEAVLRRFDGDVGWMVRSVFKHVTPGMWLRYARNKDNWSAIEFSQRRVVSSLVHNRLLTKDKGYAGQMHVFMRRLELKTEVKTPEQLAELSDRIASEVIAITASPWGWCLLKQRTQESARCAEFGVPARHNASPELCLSCAHNFMQSTNIEWALQNAGTHLEVLKHPDVPRALADRSFNVIRLIAHQVRVFDPAHEALEELNQAMLDYTEPEKLAWS